MHAGWRDLAAHVLRMCTRGGEGIHVVGSGQGTQAESTVGHLSAPSATKSCRASSPLALYPPCFLDRSEAGRGGGVIGGAKVVLPLGHVRVGVLLWTASSG